MATTVVTTAPTTPRTVATASPAGIRAPEPRTRRRTAARRMAILPVRVDRTTTGRRTTIPASSTDGLKVRSDGSGEGRAIASLRRSSRVVVLHQPPEDVSDNAAEQTVVAAVPVIVAAIAPVISPVVVAVVLHLLGRARRRSGVGGRRGQGHGQRSGGHGAENLSH